MNEYYMYDNLGNVSYDIDFSINSISLNTYKIDVYPSDEFLKSATYPVTIDPEITVQNDGYSEECFAVDIVDIASSNVTYGVTNNFTITNGVNKDSEADDTKAYFNVTIPYEYKNNFNLNLLKTSQFMYASIKLRAIDTNVSDDSHVELRQIELNSSYGEVNYLNQNSFISTFIDSEYFHNNNVFEHKFDVYNLIKNKLETYTSGNLNFMFELAIKGEANSNITYFGGLDTAGDATDFTLQPPSLKIGYLNEAGIKDYFTYEQLNVSDETNVYIAHNSGNLTAVLNDYSQGLINLSHIYNDNRKHNTSFYGAGFNINYNEYITESNNTYILTEGDGNEIKFIYDSTNQKYIDTSGSCLNLLVSETEYRIDSMDDIIKIYGSNGRLKKIYFE